MPESSDVLAVLGDGLVDPVTPVARVDDAGLTRGDGCFEGCRVLVDSHGRGSVDKLDAHLARMSRSAAALDIAFDVDAWRRLVTDAVTAWAATGQGEAAMKLLLSRGPASTGAPTGLVWITALSADYSGLRRRGLTVVTLARGVGSDAFADSPWLLGSVKTLSYAINMAAQREAARRGADDAIFVSTDGMVLESPTGSVVWAAGRTLHTTPTGATGILAGTTQQLLFHRAPSAGWQVRETLATVDDLHEADVVWIISSVRGPVDVVELDGKTRQRQPDTDAEIRRLCGF
ncbi:aminotransferase class IV [uncultured Jatrophihabitans sp.]|uniref:aminotransferase class IV n=1 Tax=uncultured Jatrophihabitans sp. TaxID=1610747 RepID=UPI0035CC2E33